MGVILFSALAAMVIAGAHAMLTGAQWSTSVMLGAGLVGAFVSLVLL